MVVSTEPSTHRLVLLTPPLPAGKVTFCIRSLSMSLHTLISLLLEILLGFVFILIVAATVQSNLGLIYAGVAG